MDFKELFKKYFENGKSKIWKDSVIQHFCPNNFYKNPSMATLVFNTFWPNNFYKSPSMATLVFWNYA